MKKVLSFVLAGAMVLSLAACGDPGSTSGQAPGSAGSSTQVTEVTGLTEPIAETPALITSAGQSADAGYCIRACRRGQPYNTLRTL